ncbi:aminoacyl-tRNA hydrolase [Candidatus Microgenomates bacterium]|nr:aminoacyl-tRNA hydrolase [Candidatus Microgenomates bacterium]
MYLVVGLGNPGEKYKLNRHNIGFMYMDDLAKKLNLEFKFDKYLKSEIAEVKGKVLLAKPQTFMNDSGLAVQTIKDKYNFQIPQIHIVHDDLDIKLGENKMQQGIGPKVHNGVNDIEEKLKDKNFWRLRIGVDNRDIQNRIPGEAYVLQDFNTDELQIINSEIDKMTDELISYFK